LKPISIKYFLFRILLWVPISLAIWYFSYPALLFLSSILSNILLPFISNHAIHLTQLNADNISLDIITNFIDRIPNEPADKKGRMAFTINVMKYAYGLPFFIALALASPTTLSIKIRNIIFCILLVTLVQLWGISFEVFKILNYEMGEKVSAHMAASYSLKEFIKLGYHLGALIIPSVAPITLWFVLYQKYYILSEGKLYLKT